MPKVYDQRYLVWTGEKAKNTLRGCGWGTTFLFTFLTFAFSASVIGVAAAAIAQWKSTRNRLRNEAAANGITLDVLSLDLYPAGVAILTLACFTTLITAIILLHLLLHNPKKNKKPAHRGYCGVPTFYWAQAPLLLVLSWLTFALIVSYTHFYRTGSALIRGYLPDGGYIFDTQIAALNLSITSLRYNNFPNLLNVVVLAWFAFFFGFIASISLFLSADEVVSYPKLLQDCDLEKRAPTGAPAVSVEQQVQRDGLSNPGELAEPASDVATPPTDAPAPESATVDPAPVAGQDVTDAPTSPVPEVPTPTPADVVDNNAVHVPPVPAETTKVTTA